ncbi:hypothetical protein ACOMHN_022851 [Nucella lapillus]
MASRLWTGPGSQGGRLCPGVEGEACGQDRAVREDDCVLVWRVRPVDKDRAVREDDCVLVWRVRPVDRTGQSGRTTVSWCGG